MIEEELIRQLADPACYPDNPETVSLHQTHLSLVCVAGNFAYKLKKSIRLPFVDFSTTELRRQSCEREVTLNRRLCPDLYLGVVPLVATSAGPRFLSSKDRGAARTAAVIEYAVYMRRLPADRMMDQLLAGNEVKPEDLVKIAGTMVAFHRQAVLKEASMSEAVASASRLRDFALANYEETRAAAQSGLLDPGLHRLLHQRTQRDFRKFLPLLQQRARSGRVVEGHGDLHARNICLCLPPALYDCVEFNRDLRVQDVAAENAFLAMDLRFRGHHELAQIYLDHYIALAKDPGQHDLMPALVRYRAMVRSKVAAIAAREHEIPPPVREKHVRSARRHLHLAAASAIEESDSWLVCATGLPGTGKTHAFKALARATGWPLIASDLVRKELAGVGTVDPLPASCYSPEFSDRTYRALIAQADRALADGPVLLDANFPTELHRRKAVASARRVGARLAFVWFQVDAEEVEKRLKARASDPDVISDADINVYRKLRAVFEPLTQDASEAMDSFLLITCRGDQDHKDQTNHILRNLLTPRPGEVEYG